MLRNQPHVVEAENLGVPCHTDVTMLALQGIVSSATALISDPQRSFSPLVFPAAQLVLGSDHIVG